MIARPLPPRLRHRAFAVAEARALGVGAHRLRRRDLRAPFRGVREHSGAADDLVARCCAYATIAHPRVVFTFATAAMLWGIPIPWWLAVDGRVHVLHIGGANVPEGARLRGHRTKAAVEVRRQRGLRVASPVHTWAQLARMLPLDDLIAAGDFLVSGSDPLATIEELRAITLASAGRRGVTRMRAALEEIEAGSRSPRETSTRLAIMRAGLPRPELNGAVALPDGTIVHGDLVWRRHRVLLEYEGDQHRTDDWQWAHDLGRYNALILAGWIPIRISKRDGPGRVVSLVRRALASRTATPDS